MDRIERLFDLADDPATAMIVGSAVAGLWGLYDAAVGLHKHEFLRAGRGAIFLGGALAVLWNA